MAEEPTIAVHWKKFGKEPVIINAADFDPDIHQRIDEAAHEAHATAKEHAKK